MIVLSINRENNCTWKLCLLFNGGSWRLSNKPNVEEAIDLYIKTCSLKINTSDLANAGAVIANGGLCPFYETHFFQYNHQRLV